jgi:hypothetical protein
VAFQYRGWDREQLAQAGRSPAPGHLDLHGLALDTTRTLDDVLRAYSLDGEGYGFDAPCAAAADRRQAHRWLESRAQARRVATRLQNFRRAEVDFSGIQDVGHGFADELFRVFRAAPERGSCPWACRRAWRR